MKVLQINKYHYVRGGSDSVYFNTTRLLQLKGHQVIHFAMDYPENEFSVNSVFFAENKDFTKNSFAKNIVNLPSFFYNRDAAEKLTKLIIEEKPDIAHLHIFYGSLTSSILKVLNEHRVPAVVSVHDYKFICPDYLLLNGKNEICEKCGGKNYYHAVLNNCIKKSRAYSTFFALESYYRDTFYPLDKMFKRLIFVSNFSLEIHNKYKPELKSISTHLYNFDPDLETKKFNQVKGDYFLFFGRLSKEKGLRTLVKAFSGLPGINLKVAGTGDELEFLKEASASNIEFLGFVKGEPLKELISNASFIIVPSEWYENNPMTIIESYSLGKPVIAARIGGIPEIVVDKVTGYLYESADAGALKEVVESANAIQQIDYENMSMSAKKFAHDNFHPEIHYQKLIKIYQEAIGL
ncbi:MAG: glycosyltransferase family 4 protein [Bacteroidota bacterium]